MLVDKLQKPIRAGPTLSPCETFEVVDHLRCIRHLRINQNYQVALTIMFFIEDKISVPREGVIERFGFSLGWLSTPLMSFYCCQLCLHTYH